VNAKSPCGRPRFGPPDSGRQQILQYISSPDWIPLERKITGEDGFRLFNVAEPKDLQQHRDILAVLKFLSQSHGETFHRKQVFGLRREYLKVTELLINVEPGALAKESFNSVVQPIVRESLALADALSGALSIKRGPRD
jgi:hypothetical protein